jgi:hypothetical protein
MKLRYLTILLLFLTCIAARLKAAEPTQVRWDFNDTQGWTHEHQDDASSPQYTVNDGKLVIFTRANTYDRQKMHTENTIYTSGTYEWRTFISELNVGDQVSIGSWIYSDDQHELDFEVGSGTEVTRKAAGAASGELVACMTSQDLPYASTYTPIKPGWHDFSIKLEPVEGKYLAVWMIDGVEKQRVQLQYGEETAFRIYCSVENLKFIGDRQARTTNYGMFDYVTFNGKIKK